MTAVTTLNVGVSQYTGVRYSLQDITLSTRGTVPFGTSGYYAALTVASAWSGRASKLYPYAGLSIGFRG